MRLFMNNEYPSHGSTTTLNTSWKDNNKITKGNNADYGLTQQIFDDILNTFNIPSA